jgi:hypothetical protein
MTFYGSAAMKEEQKRWKKKITNTKYRRKKKKIGDIHAKKRIR